MKKFFALFTHNWGLKLLALILALIVFYSVRDSRKHHTGETHPTFNLSTEKTPSNVLPTR